MAKLTEAEIVVRGRDRLAAVRAENQLLEIQVIMSFASAMGEVGPYVLVRLVGLVSDDEWAFGMGLNRDALQAASDAEVARIEGMAKARADGN